MPDQRGYHWGLWAVVGFVLVATFADTKAQSGTVTGQIIVSRPAGVGGSNYGNGDAVIWLMPLDNDSRSQVETLQSAAPPRGKIVQKDKQFLPHVLPVMLGSEVEFPNLDPVFHNVFSLYNGKRFDLGLYEAGTSAIVKFDRLGICYIFCNIHPEMSAIVIVLDTPLFAVSNSSGQFSIHNVPPGRYMVSIWHPLVAEDGREEFIREFHFSAENTSLGTLRIKAVRNFPIPHKNKYGMDYEVTPTPTTPPY